MAVADRTPAATERDTSLPARAARLADSTPFAAVVFLVIVLNAAVLGAETYAGFEARHGATLDLINNACLGVFVVELAIRIVAYGRRPQDFFRSGWNVFDFVGRGRRRSRPAWAATPPSCAWCAWRGSCASSRCCPTCASC